MRFGLTLKTLTFALAAAASAPMLISGEIDLRFALLVPALGLLGWFLEPPVTTGERFRRLVSVAVVALLAAQILRVALGEPPVRAGLEFATALLAVKLASRGTAADTQQIVALSFLQIIAATIVVDDLSYAASFLAVLFLAPPALALAHLRSEMERRFGSGTASADREMLGRLLASRRVVSLAFVLGCAGLALPVLLVTSALFVSFPRIGLGLLGRASTGRSLLGFANEVKLGDLSAALDDTVLVRLEPLGAAARPTDHLALKLRGAAFDRYSNDTWRVSSPRSWRRLPALGHEHRLAPGPIPEDAPGFVVYLESMDPPILFLPEGTGLVVPSPVVHGGALVPRALEMNHLGAVRYEDASRTGLRYIVRLAGAPPPGPSDSTAGSLLEFPAGMEAVASLAREMAGSGTPQQRAVRLMRNLRQRYRYSLDLGRPGAGTGTPLDRFLFVRRTGTCEHFATALALMLRAQGIPSRLVTGFSSASWNPIGGYWAVRQRSAHSWVEALLDGRWTTLDPTPAAPEGSVAPRPSTLALFVDAMRMRWLRHVIGYDAATQEDLAERLRALWVAARFGGRGTSIGPVPWRAVALAAAGFAVAAAVLWLSRRRRTPAQIATKAKTTRLHEATRLYLALERELRRLGLARPARVTPAEHARALHRAGVPVAPAVSEITRRYNEARFGGRPLGREEISGIRRAIRDLRLAAASSGPHSRKSTSQ